MTTTQTALDLTAYTPAQIKEARARSLGCGAATPCHDPAVATLAAALRRERTGR